MWKRNCSKFLLNYKSLEFQLVEISFFRFEWIIACKALHVKLVQLNLNGAWMSHTHTLPYPHGRTHGHTLLPAPTRSHTPTLYCKSLSNNLVKTKNVIEWKNVFLQKTTTILNATVTDLKEEKKSLHLPSVIEYLNGKGECVRVRERERDPRLCHFAFWMGQLACQDGVHVCVREREWERVCVCFNVGLFKRR